MAGRRSRKYVIPSEDGPAAGDACVVGSAFPLIIDQDLVPQATAVRRWLPDDENTIASHTAVAGKVGVARCGCPEARFAQQGPGLVDGNGAFRQARVGGQFKFEKQALGLAATVFFG